MNFVSWDFLAAAEPLSRLELPVMALKHRKATVTLAQAQNPSPGMLDHARCLEHHLVHHRADATAFGCMAHRRIRIIERVLPNHAQQVHRHGGKLAHQVVGVKLATDQFFLGKAVVHGKGVKVNRGVATVQGAEVNGLAGNALTQQLVVDLGDQIKPLRGKGVQTLAQRGAGGHVTQVQGAFEEVVFAQAQQRDYDFRTSLLAIPARMGKEESSRDLSLVDLRY
jgi:hypothetical protein